MNAHAYLVTPDGGSPTLVSAESPAWAVIKLARAIEGRPVLGKVVRRGGFWFLDDSKFQVQPA